MSAPIQRNFSIGEVAPAYYASADRALYRAALRTLRNAYVMRTGGITSRPGTRYKGTTKGSAAARLVPCVFSDSLNFVVEFGDEYIRFWRNGSPVTATVTGAWADATAYTIGIVVSYSGTNYVCLQAHTSVAATNEPTVGSSWADYWYALTGTTYEWPSPYTDTDIDDVQFATQESYGVSVHPSFAPYTLKLESGTNVWSFVATDFTLDTATPQNVAVSGTSGTGWGYAVAAWVYNGQNVRTPITGFVRTNITDVSLAAFAATVAAANRTVTWTAVTDAAIQAIYGAGAVLRGYSIYLTSDATNTFARRLDVFTESGGTPPTSFVDTGAGWVGMEATVVGSHNVPPEITGTFASAGEYPSMVGFHQQRLVLGAADNWPGTVYASRTAAPFDFTVEEPIRDNDAISWRQTSARSVTARHIVEIANRSLLFTNIGEFLLRGEDGSLIPGAVNPRQLSFNGAATVSPLPISDTLLYVQARGNQVRNLVPENQDGYFGTDLSRTARHLTDRYTTTAWCYQEIPDSVIWLVRSDGTLLSMTYERESGVIGWATHDTEGGTFESICCVPEGQEDAVYVIVLRGATRCVERFAPRRTYGGITGVGLQTPCMDAVVDGALPVSDTVTGLAHLNGEAVGVVVGRLLQSDGDILASPYNPAYATATVSGGSVTVTGISGELNVMVGLPIVMDVETLDLDTAQSSRFDSGINIKRVGLHLEETLALWAANTTPASSTAVTDLQPLPIVDEDGNATTDAVTGYREVTVDGTWTRGGRIFLRSVDPTPVTIHAISPQGDFGR